MTQEQKEQFLGELLKLHGRYELSKTVEPDYFEPGMMEYLDQSEGLYDPVSGQVLLRFEARGTRYDGRTAQIERVKPGDKIQVVRERENPFNANNFTLLTARGRNVGNMPAELCNAMAPLYDDGELVFEKAMASFVEPISRRSRHAKQAVLFVELRARLADGGPKADGAAGPANGGLGAAAPANDGLGAAKAEDGGRLAPEKTVG